MTLAAIAEHDAAARCTAGQAVEAGPMAWQERAVAWAKRMGFWRLAALGVALLVLWLALRGWTEPSAVNMRRR